MTSALVLSRYFPFNATRIHAVYQRLGIQIEALARVVDRVDCLFLIPPEQQCGTEELREHEEHLRALWTPALKLRLAAVVREPSGGSAWQRLGHGVFDFRAHPIVRGVDMDAAVSVLRGALAEQPGLVLVHRLSAMAVVLEVAAELAETPVFFDMDDIEHIAWTRRLLRDPDPTWPWEKLLLLQTPRLMLAEVKAIGLAQQTFVCSERDRRYLARLVGSGRVQTVSNSVSFPALSAADETEPLVLFVGSMASRPNAQAVDSLVHSIWPKVRAAMPDARLAIIGQGAELTSSHALRDPTVSFLGFVEDLAAWYRRARVVCCPIYHGSGTRVKIIEAAAHRKAVVATPMGAEGLSFVDGEEIVLRKAPMDLAAACVELLRDPSAASRLGAQARRRAQQLYDRNVVVQQLADIFRIALPQFDAAACAKQP
jgi:glycosyltransferase involved in cell wall biosynthesis